MIVKHSFNMKNIFLIMCLFLLFPFVKPIYATPEILITQSGEMDKVVFDGKWTNILEWKQSSWDQVPTPNGYTLHIRTAHQDDFIYILLDVVGEQSFDHISDMAMICFDGLNDKTSIPGADDYCFSTSLTSKQGFVYQGGSSLGFNGNFKKIQNSDGFIGVGGVSDENDKYSIIPHVGYEFKIPMNIFGRSDVYGFYVLVYDANNHMYISWPPEISPKDSHSIPSPANWGTLVSPDKSIPEFELPTIALIISIILATYFTRYLQKQKEIRFTLK